MDKKSFKYQIAVATSDGIVVNQHFGRTDQFIIYGVDHDSAVDFLEERKVIPICQAGNHDDARMKECAQKLSDCKYVLVSRIGQGASNVLEQEGIIPIELPGFIKESIQKIISYDKVQDLLNE